MTLTKRRWLQIGVVLSLLGVVIGLALAAQVPHRYGGGTVRVRAWLVILSSAIALPCFLGAACMAKVAPWPPIQWLFGGAAACWLLHGVLIVTLIDQPLPPGSGWITGLTILVCLPSVLRAVALMSSHYGRLFALLDLVICVVYWTETPVEVIARGHVAQGSILAVVPGVLALVAVGLNSDV